MKQLITLICLLMAFEGYSQSPQFSVGLEAKSNFWRYPFQHAAITGDAVFLDSTLMIRGTLGGFFPKSDDFNGNWNGRMFTIGVTAGYYLRSGKKYQPGITFEAQTMFTPSSADAVTSDDFTYAIAIEGTKFRGIPFGFSPKIVHLFWSNRLGIELGCGYRYYLRHLQSEFLTNFYRPLHTIEWSLGLKFQIGTK